MKRLSLVSAFVLVAAISTVSAANDVDDATLRQIANYRLWNKVNSEPITINTEPIRLAATLPKVSLMDPGLRDVAV